MIEVTHVEEPREPRTTFQRVIRHFRLVSASNPQFESRQDVGAERSGTTARDENGAPADGSPQLPDQGGPNS